jgi:stress response protein YsnF
MVVEEITLTKRVLQETQHITDTLQKEKLRIERRGNVNIQGDNIDNDQSYTEAPTQSPFNRPTTR